jgi:hypothetical protein
MRILAVMGTVLFALLLASCAPGVDTVEPQETEELVAEQPFSEVYATVVNTINTQPYPSDSGGWIITQSDQVGGFVSAQLNGTRCGGWLAGCHDYVARVSVALVDRTNDTTAVNLSFNRHEESLKLVQRIRERLGLGE